YYRHDSCVRVSNNSFLKPGNCDMSKETESDRVDQRPLADDSAPVNEALDDAATVAIDDEPVPSWSTPAQHRAASAKEEK
ncbi:MAG TPA: hypothetical protein P5307_23820, partial [Pirellulaceae bacterium]|nr:hypothetical protein [Pirellulaceae bacterium]